MDYRDNGLFIRDDGLFIRDSELSIRDTELFIGNANRALRRLTLTLHIHHNQRALFRVHGDRLLPRLERLRVGGVAAREVEGGRGGVVKPVV